MIDFELRSNRVSALMAAIVPMEALPTLSRVERLCQLGNGLMDKTRYAEALVQFNSAIDCQADHADAWLGRGKALYLCGRHQDALSSLERAADLFPMSDSRLVLMQAQVWLALKAPQRGLDCCNVVLASANCSSSEYRQAQYLKLKSLVKLRRYTELFVRLRERLGMANIPVEGAAEHYLTEVSPVAISCDQL